MVGGIYRPSGMVGAIYRPYGIPNIPKTEIARTSNGCLLTFNMNIGENNSLCVFILEKTKLISKFASYISCLKVGLT